jgi:DNA-binding MarR family transcriptional regulator
MKEKTILSKIKTLEIMVERKLTQNKKLNLTPTQMHILHILLNEDNISQKQLEDKLKLTRATVSTVLKTMEKNGLITRSICNEDTRTKQIHLSETSQFIYEEKIKEMHKIEEDLLKGMSKQEVEKLDEILDKMIANGWEKERKHAKVN